MPDFDYDLIDSIEQLQFYADRLRAEVALGRRFGFDIETGYEGEEREKAQLHPEEGLVAGISLGACEASGTVWGRYAALCHDTGPNLDNQEAAEILWRLLITGHGVPHNASFEIRFLAVWFMAHLADHPELGPEVRRRLGYIPVYSDTMIEAFVEAKFKSSKHRSSDDGIGSEAALKPLTAETFGHAMTEIFELFETISGKEMTKKQKNSIRFNVLDLTGPHKRMIIDYVCEDAVWALAHHYKRYPDVQNSLIFNVEMAVVPCVVEMDAEGIVFDWQEMRETAVIAREFGDKLKDEILSDLTVMRNERGFTDGPCQINLGSVPQLSKVLYEDLGFPVKHKSRKTGKASTDKIAMKELSFQHDVVKKILTWRGLRKLVGTWLEEWPRAYTYAADGRAHPHFIQTAVSAGRFAATDPAIMTAPKEYHLELATGERFDFNFRDLVICPPGFYGLGYDYSQIELRVLAGESGETILSGAFAHGEDVHSLTASRMLNIPLDQVDPKTHRQTGKTLNFALNYQMGPDGLADRLGISKEEAQELYDAFFAGYPRIKSYMERCASTARRNGCIYTRFGRKVVIWEYDDPRPYIQAHGDRVAGNAPIQGGCLPADTRVLTRSGWIPIGDFEDGSGVWTGAEWAPAVKLSMGAAPRVRLHLSDGRAFDCDDRHRLLVNDGPWPSWRLVTEIGDAPLVRDEAQDWGLPDGSTVDDWYWVGRFVGDGAIWNGANKRINWKMSFDRNKEAADIARFRSWLGERFKSRHSRQGFSERPDSVNGWSFVGTTDSGVGFWASHGLRVGDRAKTLRVPPAVFTLDRERRAAFCEGYLDADGHLRRGGDGQKLTSASRSGLEDMLRLFQTIGRTGRIGKEIRLAGRAKDGSDHVFWELNLHKTPHSLHVERAEYLPAEEMLTLSVLHDRHAFSSEGLISKNSADYMKISMVRVRKALRKAGLQDKVRIWLNMHDALEFYVHKSLSPLEVIQALQPAVVWTHPLIAHWPPMVADWHVWEKWGSPRNLKLEFGPDGMVTAVIEEEPEETVPPRASWLADEDAEGVPELEAVDLPLVREAAPEPEAPAGVPPGSMLVIDVPEVPVQDDFARLLRLVQSRPGTVPVSLRTPDGEILVIDGCGLTEASRPEVALILRGAELRVETPAASAV